MADSGYRNLHWAFARLLKVLETLGNSFFSGAGEVTFLVC